MLRLFKSGEEQRQRKFDGRKGKSGERGRRADRRTKAGHARRRSPAELWPAACGNWTRRQQATTRSTALAHARCFGLQKYRAQPGLSTVAPPALLDVLSSADPSRSLSRENWVRHVSGDLSSPGLGQLKKEAFSLAPPAGKRGSASRHQQQTPNIALWQCLRLRSARRPAAGLRRYHSASATAADSPAATSAMPPPTVCQLFNSLAAVLTPPTAAFRARLTPDA